MFTDALRGNGPGGFDCSGPGIQTDPPAGNTLHRRVLRGTYGTAGRIFLQNLVYRARRQCIGSRRGLFHFAA